MGNLVICEICGTTFNSNDENDVCSVCRKRINGSTSHKTRAAGISMEAKTLGCKTLTGTPKQKGWGESIRKSFIENAQDIKSVRPLIVSRHLSSAKSWIDSRNNENLEAELIEVLTLTAELNAGDMTGMDRREELINKLF